MALFCSVGERESFLGVPSEHRRGLTPFRSPSPVRLSLRFPSPLFQQRVRRKDFCFGSISCSIRLLFLRYLPQYRQLRLQNNRSTRHCFTLKDSRHFALCSQSVGWCVGEWLGSWEEDRHRSEGEEGRAATSAGTFGANVEQCGCRRDCRMAEERRMRSRKTDAS